MAPGQQSKLFRFGVYEADAATGELRKSGVRLRLQEQPFQVLLVLLERQGQVITREELRLKLWPADTFVDFDHGLNTIINKLREVLGDSASNPRFIETLARRGYRFLAPVERVEGNAAWPAAPAEAKENPAGPTAAAALSSSVLTRMEELPRVPRHYVRVLFFLIQVMYLSFYIAALARLPRVEDLLEQAFGRPGWITSVLVVTAIVGIPIRFYLLSGISFDLRDLRNRFQRLFVAILMLDGLWALAPFLLAPQIGIGLALAATGGAALRAVRAAHAFADERPCQNRQLKLAPYALLPAVLRTPIRR